MTLQEKVLNLKLEAATAARLAMFWEKQIHTHGERKTEAFYTHLGLNHIERKGFEWEGLTLSREPKEHEKLCVKGIANAQETAKEQIGKVLLSLRTELIAQGVEAIQTLAPKDYHTLILEVPEGSKADLRARLEKVYLQGRKLVDQELSKQKAGARYPLTRPEHLFVVSELGKKEALPEEEFDFDLLDDLADITDSRIVNDVQTRITAAAARYRLLGLGDAALWKAVEDEIRLGSVSYINRASQGLANRVINIGRRDEARSRRDEWERVEYSAILDSNVCDPCVAEDGQEATNEEDLEPVPNASCPGECRCFHVYVAEGNM